MSQKEKVVCRFAPSPTGLFHIGGARTALFNYLFARKHGGKLILRFEDTDKERSKPEFERNIREGLVWMGLDFDEEHKQSERTHIYKKYILKLIDDDKAYLSKEEKDGVKREVVRFKNKNEVVTFKDMIRGEITFDTSELKDFVLAKSVEEPLYHLAVVVDDHDMGVTHVVRGEDHISNTARQILIIRAIGASVPEYAHIPLILAPDRSKLSKRHGAVALTEYRDKGYLPEAMINYLASLGWNSGDDREIFSLEELVSEFGMDRVQKGGAIFNEQKLKSINKIYMHENNTARAILEDKILKSEKYGKQSSEFDSKKMAKIADIILERVSVLEEADGVLEDGEIDFVYNRPKFDVEKLFWKDETDKTVLMSRLVIVRGLLENLSDVDFTHVVIKNTVWGYAEKEGKGAVLWPFRYALTGREKSVDPFTAAEILGKHEVVDRLSLAVDLLS